VIPLAAPFSLEDRDADDPIFFSALAAIRFFFESLTLQFEEEKQRDYNELSAADKNLKNAGYK